MSVSSHSASLGERVAVAAAQRASSPDRYEVVAKLASSVVPAGAKFARWWLGARQLREELFGSALASDSCWYIFLDLYQASAQGRKVSITSLPPMIGSPHSTAGRRTRTLINEGLLIRTLDPMDRRRSYVELGPDIEGLMSFYFWRLSERGEPPRLAP